MPSMERIIQAENRKKLAAMSNDTKLDKSENCCNCLRKNKCPLEGKCKTESIVYKAEVSSEGKTETYIGLTSTDFKARYGNHKNSFTNPAKRHSTELSKYIWKLKDEKKDFNIKWNIMCKASTYNSNSKKCNLCLAEKYYIICHPEWASLNKRSELISKCRHELKCSLSGVT